jgi:hypothetical protein
MTISGWLTAPPQESTSRLPARGNHTGRQPHAIRQQTEADSGWPKSALRAKMWPNSDPSPACRSSVMPGARHKAAHARFRWPVAAWMRIVFGIMRPKGVCGRRRAALPWCPPGPAGTRVILGIPSVTGQTTTRDRRGASLVASSAGAIDEITSSTSCLLVSGWTKHSRTSGSSSQAAGSTKAT